MRKIKLKIRECIIRISLSLFIVCISLLTISAQSKFVKSDYDCREIGELEKSFPIRTIIDELQETTINPYRKSLLMHYNEINIKVSLYDCGDS